MNRKSYLLALLAGTLMVALSGCKGKNNLIEKVLFQPSEDLKTVRLSLVFKNNIQSIMAGGVDTDYGHFFINPFTPVQPFEIGFDLDMGIFYDQHYIGLQPTNVLPNGLPMGIPYPVVEVKSPTPIHQKFDLFGYVDVAHQSWLGVAAMFSFLNDQYFPPDLSLQQVFMREQTSGKPRVLASIFGPVVDSHGTLVRNGGIALFADVKSLIQQYKNKKVSISPKGKIQPIGPNAKKVTPKMLRKIERNLIKGLNLK